MAHGYICPSIVYNNETCFVKNREIISKRTPIQITNHYDCKSANSWVLEVVGSCEVMVHNTRRTATGSLIRDLSSKLATYLTLIPSIQYFKTFEYASIVL